MKIVEGLKVLDPDIVGVQEIRMFEVRFVCLLFVCLLFVCLFAYSESPGQDPKIPRLHHHPVAPSLPGEN